MAKDKKIKSSEAESMDNVREYLDNAFFTKTVTPVSKGSTVLRTILKDREGRKVEFKIDTTSNRFLQLLLTFNSMEESSGDDLAALNAFANVLKAIERVIGAEKLEEIDDFFALNDDSLNPFKTLVVVLDLSSADRDEPSDGNGVKKK